MAVAFGCLWLVPGAATPLLPFLLLFGATYFFAEFGPNTTTFVYPAEIFPVRVRTTSHGIAAAAGKIGAFIGTYALTALLPAIGLAVRRLPSTTYWRGGLGAADNQLHAWSAGVSTADHVRGPRHPGLHDQHRDTSTGQASDRAHKRVGTDAQRRPAGSARMPSSVPGDQIQRLP